MFPGSHTDPLLWRDVGEEIVYVLGGQYRISVFISATNRHLELHHGSSHSHASLMLRLCSIRIWKNYRR
jgi:hypothetical protein